MNSRTIAKLVFMVMALALLPSCGEQGGTRNSSSQQQSGSIQVVEMIEKRPTYLYKVLSMDDWARSCETVHLSSMDTDFIHLSTEDQLDKIIEKYWAGASEYVVLKIETAKLSGDLVLEANPGGTNKYYHLYKGFIPLNAVVESKVHKK